MTTKPTMTVTYTKTLGVPAIHRWPGGLVATTLPWTGGLPHDLGHWMMETQVDLPWGFWSLAGRRTPFRSFTLVEGRWPRDAAAKLDRVRRKHGLAMLHAEGHDGKWLADPDLDVRGDWSLIHRRLAVSYCFEDNPLIAMSPTDVERLRPLALAVAEQWDRLVDGGCLLVRWPGAGTPEEVDPLVYGPSTLPPPHRVTVTARNERGERAIRLPTEREWRKQQRHRKHRNTALV